MWENILCYGLPGYFIGGLMVIAVLMPTLEKYPRVYKRGIRTGQMLERAKQEKAQNAKKFVNIKDYKTGVK